MVFPVLFSQFIPCVSNESSGALRDIFISSALYTLCSVLSGTPIAGYMLGTACSSLLATEHSRTDEERDTRDGTLQQTPPVQASLK